MPPSKWRLGDLVVAQLWPGLGSDTDCRAIWIYSFAIAKPYADSYWNCRALPLMSVSAQVSCEIAVPIRDFPVHPMPLMLEPLSEAELVQYRDDLARRFKRLAVGD
jgi:hypothetical protein